MKMRNHEISIKIIELIYTNSDDNFYGYTMWPKKINIYT